MLDINKFLKELRKRRGLTLREVADRSGLSHSYISSLESGVHPKTKAPIKPSPDSLRGLAIAFNYDYEELMIIAGYSSESKKESDITLSGSEYDFIVSEAEKKYKVNLRDDPFVAETIKDIIENYARSKQGR